MLQLAPLCELKVVVCLKGCENGSCGPRGAACVGMLERLFMFKYLLIFETWDEIFLSHETKI